MCDYDSTGFVISFSLSNNEKYFLKSIYSNNITWTNQMSDAFKFDSMMESIRYINVNKSELLELVNNDIVLFESLSIEKYPN